MSGDQIQEIEHALATSSTAIAYTIHSYSSFSGNFRPSNIIVDKPKDASSRWSAGLSATGPHPPRGQVDGMPAAPGSAWVMLELFKPSIVGSITFGKHWESHPCNPQSVTILAGTEPKHLREIFSGRLRNDTQPETKTVSWRTKLGAVETSKSDVWEANRKAADAGNIAFAVKYIKILPGPAYEARFNPSIWHVAVQGVTSESLITKVQRRYLQAQTLQANRVMLKYLRANQMAPAFNALYDLMRKNPDTPQPVLEHPLLTDLHAAVVEQGDYERAEALIDTIMEQGLMDDHIARLPVAYQWHQVQPHVDENGLLVEPPRRGGHAICLSPDGRSLFLFGGWDGQSELDDFWVRSQGADIEGDTEYESSTEPPRWRRIERKSEDAAWPSARSGHAMTVSGKTLYLMGAGDPRLDVVIAAPPHASTARSPATVEESSSRETFGLISSDLTDVVEHGLPEHELSRGTDQVWTFDLEQEEWSVLEEAGSTSDRPGTMEVKDMCVRNNQLYVYGTAGRVTGARGRLYAFDLSKREWSRLHSIPTTDETTSSSSPAQLSVFDPRDESLLLLDGGSASPALPAQLWRNMLQTDRLQRLESLGRQVPPLKPGHPVRGFYDEKNGDIVVIFGHGKGCILPKHGRTSQIWRYSVRLAEWFPMPDSTEDSGRRSRSVDVRRSHGVLLEEEPEDLMASRKEGSIDLAMLQRCGHQMVYNPWQDTCLVIGSSTPAHGDQANDYRMLTFDRPGRATVKRKCLLAIRKQKFIDMVSSSPSMQALHYLQGPLHAVVDHDAPDESKHFRALLAHLLQFGSTVEAMPEGGTVMAEDHSVSSEQYAQRSGVFEAILRYISPRYKQPSGDLLYAAQDM